MKRIIAMVLCIAAVLALVGFDSVAGGSEAAATTASSSAGFPKWAVGDTALPAQIEWPIEGKKAEETAGTAAMVKIEQTEHAEKIKTAVRQVPWAEREMVSSPCIGEGSWYANLSFDKYGINQNIYVAFDQATVDDPNSVEMWGFSGMFGEPERSVILFDHNFQTGKIFASADIGDIVDVSTISGNYVFCYSGFELGYQDTSDVVYTVPKTVSKRVGVDDNTFYSDIITPSKPNGVISTGCDSSAGNNGEMYLITCYPLDAKVTSQRMIMRFECLSGPTIK